MDTQSAQKAFQAALDAPGDDENSFFLARLFGFRVEADQEVSRLTFTVQDTMRNPHGTLHGGVIALALDTCMGALLRAALGPSVTVSMTVNYIRPVKDGEVRCEARFLQSGKTVSHAEARMTDAEGKPVAAVVASWHPLSED